MPIFPKVVAGDKRKPAEVAVRYTLHSPAITAAVLGIRTQEQLADALLSGSSAGLTDDETEMLRKLLPANRYTEHR